MGVGLVLVLHEGLLQSRLAVKRKSNFVILLHVFVLSDRQGTIVLGFMRTVLETEAGPEACP